MSLPDSPQRARSLVPRGVKSGGLEERQPLGANLREAGGTYRHWGNRFRSQRPGGVSHEIGDDGP